MTYAIATAPGDGKRYHWTAETATWYEILDWAKSPATTKASGAYLAGTLGPCPCSTDTCGCDGDGCQHLARRKQSIVSRSMLTLDADTPTPGFRAAVGALGVHALVHSTYNSTTAEPRYRVIIPLDREVGPDDYEHCAAIVVSAIGVEHFDDSTRQAERFMYRPAAGQLTAYEHEDHGGDILKVDALLAETVDPAMQPPVRSSRNKRDPYEISGAIGAFNRAYEVDEAIEAYSLPYESAGASRWHLVGATSTAGMGPVAGAPGLVYSHHSGDPAGGQAVSAFDLVRLHLYADLDLAVKAETPVNRRPSHEAMLALAGKDPLVVAEMVGDTFKVETVEAEVEADRAPGGPEDWVYGLALNDKNGKVLASVENWDLIREHDIAFSGLYFNALTSSVETSRDLPWRKTDAAAGGPVFGTVDYVNLADHLERRYKIRPTPTVAEGLVLVTAHERRVSPIREYLENLSWDGTERVETCLPGVKPSTYSRMVARKVLTAAVARIFEPGIKWDHSLVLHGKEGLGKTWWIEKLARGWHGPLGDISNKDTLLSMARTWIVIADEGHSLNSKNHEAQKEFLTRTSDLIRQPYEKETRLYPRHSVIWSTTNDDVFLKRQEGNRRFLIVRCEDRVDFDSMTDAYIDQIWAEAVEIYRAGESLYLTREDSALAVEARDSYTEENALVGPIVEYLEALVPTDWDSMSPGDRALWYRNYLAGNADPGTRPIDEVCTKQIALEALGWDSQRTGRYDLAEVSTALREIPGWAPRTGTKRLPGYGPQRVHVRLGHDLI